MVEVMIMNAYGPPRGRNRAARRKQTIQNVILKHEPELVLFQEFRSKKIHGQSWKAYPIPKHYHLTGNDDASILYDGDEVKVEQKEATELQRILEELQRATTKHPTPIPQGFAPIPRMALRVVKTKGAPDMEFICISWHGKHKGLSNNKKITEFTYLMMYLKEIYVKYDLPILIAGDFNVEMKSICDNVQDPFKLIKYEASKRRKRNGVIDYFIATSELCLSHMKPVNLKKDSEADNPKEVLDHDPIRAKVEPAHLSESSCSE